MRQKNKTKLYLAHPLDSRKEVRKWELLFERVSGITLINPFYDTERTDVEAIDAGRHKRYEKLNPKQLVERDLCEIEHSNGLIGIINGVISYGTIMEITYAYHMKKPVYLLVTNGHQDHPWLKYHATEIFTKKGDLEKGLVDRYGEI